LQFAAGHAILVLDISGRYIGARILLELAILGLLKEQDLHGYELKKRLNDTLGLFSGVSFGSLYPALARLEAAGAVKAVEAKPDPVMPIPLTGSLTGELAAFRALGPTSRPRRTTGRPTRGKKVYGITDVGQHLFEELLATDNASSDDDRVFNLKLAFARHLPPEARVSLFERRRAQLVERLNRTRINLRARSDRPTSDTYTRSLIEHGTETTEREISWLDRLIAGEQDSAQAPRSEPHSQEGFTP
jgi:DNA-binding PadR family transcriptional regulator